MHFPLVLALLWPLACSQVVRMNGYLDMEPNMPPFNFLKHGTDWFGTCQTGMTLTPIDITEYPSNPANYQVVTASNSSFREIRVDMGTVRKQNTLPQSMSGVVIYWIFNHTFTQNVLGEDITHTLAEIHFMSPAAHLYNGIRYPLEMHFAFCMKQPDGEVIPGADIIILFKEGREDPVQTALLGDALELDLTSLFPPNQVLDDYYYYSGSVDIPWTECWEPLMWVMPNYILEASREQIQFWKDLYIAETADQSGWGPIRDVQPLNDRVIYHYVPSETSTSFLG